MKKLINILLNIRNSTRLTKKAKAEEILKRAQDGEDFAKLADEFSEDPGNKTPDGKKKGGLYENVTKGKMVPEFEAAALALEPGQIAPNLVETQFGYHIIKLDRKGETKDQKVKHQKPTMFVIF